MKVVYVIYSHIHQAIKIGYASDIASRISGIQTSTPEKLCLMFTFEGGKELEQYFHNRLKQFHIKGEWFSYNKFVKDFLSHYQERQFEFFTFKIDDKFKDNLYISEKEINAAIIEVANSFNKKFSIPEIKKRLPSLKLSTKEVESFLLERGWEYKQYGTCRTKYFTKPD